MKKNYSMRIASMLLVLVLLTTCVISGTFAKYVTEGKASETARVAKWGVEVVAETWADDQLEADLTTAENNIVAATGTTDLLAPGTGINFVSVNVTGTPEVGVKVTYVADLELTGWVSTGGEYMPLVFKVNNTEYKCAAGTTIDNFEKAVEDAIADYTEEYDAGDVLETEGAGKLTVSCYWAYEGNNDKYDTELGDAAADGNAPTVSLTITCTVTQVD